MPVDYSLTNDEIGLYFAYKFMVIISEEIASKPVYLAGVCDCNFSLSGIFVSAHTTLLKQKL